MAIKRITLSVPEEVASRIKKAARGRPVSAWVTNLIEDHLDDAELQSQWQRFCDDVKPSRKDTRRAKDLFSRLTRPARGKGAA